MVPPGNWHFMQDAKYKIESDSFENLVSAVQAWRIENGRDLGDVVLDIENYICNMAPHHCHQRQSGAVPFIVIDLQTTAGANFASRIGAWGNNLHSKPEARSQVSTQDAEERAKKCQGCEFNKEWEHECPKCVSHAQRILALVRLGKDLPSYKKKLHGCSKLNQCNRTAVWLKDEVLEHREDLPNHCWLKKK